MKILVLAGGLSPERDVSLSSGALISNALAENGHTVALCDLIEDDIKNVKWTGIADFSYTIPETEPDLDELRVEYNYREIGNAVIPLCHGADKVFIALHGGIGEDGQLQAVLEREGISFTGSSSRACHLAMDKDAAKIEFDKYCIPTSEWVTFDAGKLGNDEIIEKIGLPCVIKPLSCGSSCGVSKVYSEEQLDAALTSAEKYEKRLIAEKLICGREFSCGVLEGRALPPIEIIPKNGFYDYVSKYQSGMTNEICPALLSDEQNGRIMELALKAHEVLGLGKYSRSDFILDEESGEFVILEVNSLPGMTPMSLLPQEARAVGIDYHDLCEIIIRE